MINRRITSELAGLGAGSLRRRRVNRGVALLAALTGALAVVHVQAASATGIAYGVTASYTADSDASELIFKAVSCGASCGGPVTISVTRGGAMVGQSLEQFGETATLLPLGPANGGPLQVGDDIHLYAGGQELYSFAWQGLPNITSATCGQSTISGELNPGEAIKIDLGVSDPVFLTSDHGAVGEPGIVSVAGSTYSATFTNREIAPGEFMSVYTLPPGNQMLPDGNTIQVVTGVRTHATCGTSSHPPHTCAETGQTGTYPSCAGCPRTTSSGVRVFCFYGADPPVANSDTAFSKGSPVVSHVLTNDLDPDGKVIRVHGWTNGHFGRTRCTATTCTYTPASQYVDHDSYTYTIEDAQGGTNTARVFVRAKVFPRAAASSTDWRSISAPRDLSAVSAAHKGDNRYRSSENGEILSLRLGPLNLGLQVGLGLAGKWLSAGGKVAWLPTPKHLPPVPVEPLFDCASGREEADISVVEGVCEKWVGPALPALGVKDHGASGHLDNLALLQVAIAGYYTVVCSNGGVCVRTNYVPPQRLTLWDGVETMHIYHDGVQNVTMVGPFHNLKLPIPFAGRTKFSALEAGWFPAAGYFGWNDQPRF